MSTKNTNILAYIIWPLAIARIMFHTEEEKAACKFHLNQAIVLNLFTMLSCIPCIGWIWGIFCLVCWIIGLVNASNEQEKELPLIGKCRVIK